MYPTAVHLAAAVQDTALNEVIAPAGILTGWTAHALPFHRSATALDEPMLAPTAVQARADTHETPDSSDRQVGPGLRSVWIAHALPFHCSASA
jgi:hypothetical protein